MWNFDEEHALLIEDGLNNRVPNAGGINCRTKLLDRGRLFESYGDHRSAFEIDPEIKGIAAAGMKFMAVKRGAHSSQHQHNRQTEEETAPAEPVDFVVMKKSNHENLILSIRCLTIRSVCLYE